MKIKLHVLMILFAAAVIPAREIPPDAGFIPVDFPEIVLPKTELPQVQLPKVNTSPVILPKGEYL